jgi:hypothetical protein
MNELFYPMAIVLCIMVLYILIALIGKYVYDKIDEYETKRDTE